MTLTVSIPVYRTPQAMLDRAVQSVLANDSVSFVVITGDGEDVTVSSKDDRVVVWRTGQNVGRYFIDDVVSRSAVTPLFSVHDADDWSDPGRLDACVAAAVDVAYTRRMIHDRSGADRLWSPRPGPTSRLNVLWGCMAVYRTELVAGLWHPGFRVAWDAMLDQMVFRFAESRELVEGPMYHVNRTSTDSLSRSKRTGHRSEHRAKVRREHATMWRTMGGLDLAATKAYLESHPAEKVRRMRQVEQRNLERILK